MDCPHIPEQQYGQFSLRMRQKVADQRIPLVGTLELTFRCNLRCQHCYVAFGHTGVPGKQEMTTAEIQGILDQVVDAGALWFLFTGGEPLLRRDFSDLYIYAKRKGLLTTVFTNATLLTPRLADLLAEWQPFAVEITLYGATQATYEQVTGIPGSHARCLRGIELLLERQVPLKLKTMVMTLNQHEVWQMKAYAESLGVEFRFDPILNTGLQGCSKPAELRLSPQEVVQFDLADARRVQEWQRFCGQFLGVRGDQESLYHCSAGVSSFHIDPYGQLSLCVMARQPSYDLHQGSFQEGWEQFLRQQRYQPALQASDCNACDLRNLCGQCPGWASMEHGDPYSRVDYLCQVAHLRARALGFERFLETASIPLLIDEQC